MSRRGANQFTAPIKPDESYIVDAVTGCWVWQRATNSHGYGHFQVAGKLVAAHRWFYERKFGPVPDGKVLDHIACDRPACCNPDHVTPVTNAENVQRRFDSGPTRRRTSRVLTESEKQELCHRRRAGESGYSLAKEFGLSLGEAFRLSGGKGVGRRQVGGRHA